MSDYYDGAHDIDEEEVAAIISVAQLRRVGVECFCWQILHDGKWREICRTDDVDDVCTSMGEPVWFDDESNKLWRDCTEGDVRRAMREHNCLGARVGKKRFALIDALSDG